MRHPATIIATNCLIALISCPEAGAQENLKNSPALTENAVKQGPPPPGRDSPTPDPIMRPVPSIGRGDSEKETTLTPYVGAGSGTGASPPTDRSPDGAAPIQTDVPTRTQSGLGNAPDEPKMGVRIPF